MQRTCNSLSSCWSCVFSILTQLLIEVLWRSLSAVLESHCSRSPWHENCPLRCLVCWWRRKIKLPVLNTLRARKGNTGGINCFDAPYCAHWPKSWFGTSITAFKYQRSKCRQSIPNCYDKNCNFMTFSTWKIARLHNPTMTLSLNVPESLKSLHKLTAWTKRTGIHCKRALSWERHAKSGSASLSIFFVGS